MSYIGQTPTVGNFQVCDSISATATDTFNLVVGGVAVSPESAQHCLVSLNGILQAPISSYTIVGSTIVFASALTTSDSIDFITILGNVLDLGTPSDGTVTNAKLAQDIISGETALTSAPAATDEFLVSDAGVLKRVDASLVGKGKVLQHKETSSSAVATGTTLIPEDDTIPQNDEGTEVMTLAITPVSATSTMYIATQVFLSMTNITRGGIALFKDTDANAVAMTSVFIKDATSMGNGIVRYAEVTGNTTARTYKVRLGGLGGSSSTVSFNGQSGSRKFGGIDTLSSLQIIEVEA